MYFWHTNALIVDLKNNRISMLNTILYLFLHVISFILGIHVLNLLPTLYQLIFIQIKIYLEQQVSPLPLSFKIYYILNEEFLVINFALLAIGIIICFMVHKGTIKEFFERFIALSWPICFRIMLITALLFLLGIGMAGIYFVYKFRLIGQTAIGIPSLITYPFKFLSRAFGIFSPIKNIINQAEILPRLEEIFIQINTWSYGFYRIAQIGSLLSTLWWMLTLQEKMKMIKK